MKLGLDKLKEIIKAEIAQIPAAVELDIEKLAELVAAKLEKKPEEEVEEPEEPEEVVEEGEKTASDSATATTEKKEEKEISKADIAEMIKSIIPEKKKTEIKASDGDGAERKHIEYGGNEMGKKDFSKAETELLEAANTAGGITVKLDIEKAEFDGAAGRGAELLRGSLMDEIIIAGRPTGSDQVLSKFKKVAMSDSDISLAQLTPGCTTETYSTYTDQVNAMENVTGAVPATSKKAINQVTTVSSSIVKQMVVEDTVGDILSKIKAEQGKKILDDMVLGIYDGEKTTTSVDFDKAGAAATSPIKNIDGIRHTGIDAGLTVDCGAAISLANLDAMVTLSDEYESDNSFFMLNKMTYNRIMALADFKTAVNLSWEDGKLKGYRGYDFVKNAQIRKTVSATGANTEAGPNTLTTLALINPDEYILGIRRDVKLVVVFEPLKQATTIKTFVTWAWEPKIAVSGVVTPIVIGINV